MDRESQHEDPRDDVSLRDILKAVKEQGEVNSKLRQELSELKEEFHGSSLSVASQVKKLKQDQEYKWKFESNRIQFSINSEILEDLNQIIWANEIVDKVKKRNKLIKIADDSEAGWDTVKQYEANPVASDSDDENKIIKAENRALRKRKIKSATNFKKDKKPSNYSATTQYTANFPANLQQQLFRDPQTWFTGTPIYSGMPGTSSANSRKFPHGACYGCGSMQHWRNRCPFNPKADAKSKPE